jgi:YegS/Rv2252/BmrU family lipid kinase
MKHIFIVNPVAGKGKTLSVIPSIKKYFEDNPGDTFEIYLTERRAHATELAKKVVSEGTGRIYSVGGDGTLNEVLNGMIHSNFTLGVLPMGSGNDFIRTLCPGINPHDLTVEQVVEGSEKIVDCAKANDTYFINVASVGFDAEVAENMKLFKKIPLVKGALSYILSIFYTLVNLKPYTVRYAMNDKTGSSDYLLIAVCNGKYYGGGFMPAPNADLNDGLFDICHVKSVKRRVVFRCFPKLKDGTHETMRDIVSMHKSNFIHLQSDQEMCLNLDGEIFKAKDIRFEILPSSLKILVPKISS